MKSFVQTLAGLVFGVLSGFDRMMFRGHLRQLSYAGGMKRYCHFNHVKLVDFGKHAEQLTERLIDASQAEAKLLGRPIEYLPSPKVRKEDLARSIAQRDKISDGLIAVFRCVEPCPSFALRGNRATKKLEFRPELRKCLHLYHYYQHPEFGFLYGRVQTWFPFALRDRPQRSGMAGAATGPNRPQLSPPRQLHHLGRGHGPGEALLDSQLRVNWAKKLHEIGSSGASASEGLLGRFLDGILLVAQAVGVGQRCLVSEAFGVANALRDVAASCGHRRFEGRCAAVFGTQADPRRTRACPLCRRGHERFGPPHGWRAHQASRGREFNQDVRQGRPGAARGDDDQRSGRLQSLPHQGKRPRRRQELAGAAFGSRRHPSPRGKSVRRPTRRYLEGLAAACSTKTLAELLEPLGRRVTEPGEGGRTGGRKVRALTPLVGPDAALLAAVARPEFMIAGLRNRDLVSVMDGKIANDAARKRRSAQVSRQLRLLRGHGLLKKVPKSHRYQVTERGRIVLTALAAAKNASTRKTGGNSRLRFFACREESKR